MLASTSIVITEDHLCLLNIPYKDSESLSISILHDVRSYSVSCCYLGLVTEGLSFIGSSVHEKLECTHLRRESMKSSSSCRACKKLASPFSHKSIANNSMSANSDSSPCDTPAWIDSNTCLKPREAPL